MSQSTVMIIEIQAFSVATALRNVELHLDNSSIR